MKNVTTMLLFIFTISLVFMSASTNAATSANYNKLLNMCIACHGKDGSSSFSSIPNLKWQNQKYLEIQLNAFKTGERRDITMSKVVELLNKEDILKLASYFSQAKERK